MTTYDIINTIKNAMKEYEAFYLALEITKIIYKVVFNRGKQ